jgi:modification methylase
VVVTARPRHYCGELVDLPSAAIAAGRNADRATERCVALLAGLNGEHLVPRPSFFQLHNTHKARARGEPWHLIGDTARMRGERPARSALGLSRDGGQ